MLTSSDHVLEVGSGPGTYSLPIASKVNALTCLDSSPRMLDRLMRLAGESDINNIDRIDMDWKDFTPHKGYDICIATLCPGSGTPESIERMEGSARRGCVLVSWLENHGDDLNEKVWKRLGKDYGYDARKSNGVAEWLSANGRRPHTQILSTTVSADIPVDDLIAKEISAFAAYGSEIDVESIVREILEPETDNGIVHYTATNRMRLTYWFSP